MGRVKEPLATGAGGDRATGCKGLGVAGQWEMPDPTPILAENRVKAPCKRRLRAHRDCKGLGAGSSLSPEAPRLAVSDQAETATEHGPRAMPYLPSYHALAVL